MENGDDSRWEILGQKIPYPTSIYAVIGLGLFCMAVVCIVWIVLYAPPGRTEEVFALFTSLKIDESSFGKPRVQQQDGQLVQFWTPSAETKLDLQSPSSETDEDAWERVEEDKVDAFENDLWIRFHGSGSRQIGPLNGYRRYQVIGHGRTQHKRGWWWVLNVKRDFDTRELASFYFKEWHTEKTLYVELISGETSFERGR
jgi:hypothetical protein